MINKNRSLKILSLLSLMMLFPHIAHAADIFEVPSTDLSKQLFLDVLFPDDLSESPLASVIKVFVAFALMLGGVLAAYTLIAGTMQTAHDGEMLGKKWSSMWLPIRLAVGAALLLPAAGGFCAAQVLVLWCISQGVGLADNLWSAYTSGVNKTIASSSTPNGQGVYDLASKMLQSNFCIIAAQQNQQSFIDATDDDVDVDKTAYKYYKDDNASTTTKKVFNFGKDISKINYSIFQAEAWTGGALKSACGTVTITSPSSNSTVSSAATGLNTTAYTLNKVLGADYSSLNSNGVDNTTAAFSDIYKAQLEATDALQQSTYTLANSIYTNLNDPKANDDLKIATQLMTFTTNYQNSVKSSISSAFSKSNTWDTFKAAMDTQGWLMAGTWYVNVSRYQNLVSAVAQTIPEATGIINANKISDNSDFRANMKSFSSLYNSSLKDSPYISSIINKELIAPGSQTASDADDEKSGSYWTSKITGVFSPITNALASWLASNSNTSEETDPLSLVIDLGNTIDTSAWWIMGGAFALSLVFSSVMIAAITFLVPLWMFAITLSVVIPFTPYIMWMGVVAGWMILCLEAVIAAPLWIVSHLHPDADGPTGRGGSGYGLILSLLMRPALMILGLICAMLILSILIALVNQTFGATFAAVATASGGTSITQAIGVLCVYTLLTLSMVKKSFSLIHVIPDEIMKWLGVNAGSRMSDHSNNAISAIENSRAIQTTLDQSHRLASTSRDIARDIDANKNKKQNAGAQAFDTASEQLGSNNDAGDNNYQPEDGGSDAEQATGLNQSEITPDVEQSMGDLNNAGKTDMSMSANKSFIDRFNRSYPSASQCKDVDYLKEAKARSTILDAQLKHVKDNNAPRAGISKKAFDSKANRSIYENKNTLADISRVINSMDNQSNSINSEPKK